MLPHLSYSVTWNIACFVLPLIVVLVVKCVSDSPAHEAATEKNVAVSGTGELAIISDVYGTICVSNCVIIAYTMCVGVLKWDNVCKLT